MLQVTCPGQTYRFVYDPDQGGFVPFTLARQSTTPTAPWCRLAPGRICWCCTSATGGPATDPDLAAPEAPEVIVSQYALLRPGISSASEPNYQLIRLP